MSACRKKEAGRATWPLENGGARELRNFFKSARPPRFYYRRWRNTDNNGRFGTRHSAESIFTIVPRYPFNLRFDYIPYRAHNHRQKKKRKRFKCTGSVKINISASLAGKYRSAINFIDKQANRYRPSTLRERQMPCIAKYREKGKRIENRSVWH